MAGIVAAISPCVLPVLPVVLAAGSANGDELAGRRWRRPVAVVVGLVISFSMVILAGSELISALHLPYGFLRDAGIVMLVLRRAEPGDLRRI